MLAEEVPRRRRQRSFLLAERETSPGLSVASRRVARSVEGEMPFEAGQVVGFVAAQTDERLSGGLTYRVSCWGDRGLFEI